MTRSSCGTDLAGIGGAGRRLSKNRLRTRVPDKEEISERCRGSEGQWRHPLDVREERYECRGLLCEEGVVDAVRVRVVER